MRDSAHTGLEKTRTRGRTEAEWRERLTPQQYRVLRAGGSEKPGSSPLNAERRPGVFRCAGCGHELFDSTAKFEAGTGFPTFRDSLPGAVTRSEDRSQLVVLSAVACVGCGGHLGYFYEDEPGGAGPSYRINGVALTFKPR